MSLTGVNRLSESELYLKMFSPPSLPSLLGTSDTRDGAATVTVDLAVIFPSCVVQVIVADPAALAVTVPSEATVATDVLLEVHETAVFVALLGEIVAVNLDV